ncbi:MAG: DUF448 domain-containing protein [Candidatus Cloacimonadaceae bacterium]|nr:DUF448 domain-containing protein [Candidatus Cloacimonadaceae bacterium]
MCKKKVDYKQLLNFFILKDSVVFDMHRRLQTRKQYLCPEKECILGLEKWKKRRLKRVGFSNTVLAETFSRKGHQA